jgi:hypothetical protein
MEKNNIPELLKIKQWSRYRLWNEMGGNVGDRSLIYERLVRKGAALHPIPPATQWGTLKRVANALCVPISSLEVGVMDNDQL